VSAYKLAPRAFADLDNILAYGTKTWGFAAASAYVESLQQKFALLASRPGMGRPRGELGDGMRCFGHRNHLIFFMTGREGGIEIIGVPHASMDIDAYFDEEEGEA